MKKWFFLLILLCSTFLCATEQRKIILSTHETLNSAEEYLDVFIKRYGKEIGEKQAKYGFEVKARPSGKMYILVLEPFENYAHAQETARIFQSEYPKVNINAYSPPEPLEKTEIKKQSISDLFPEEALALKRVEPLKEETPITTEKTAELPKKLLITETLPSTSAQEIPELVEETFFFRLLSLVTLLSLLGLSYVVFTSWKKRKALSAHLKDFEVFYASRTKEMEKLGEKIHTMQQMHEMLLGYLHKEMLVINELIQTISGEEKELLHVKLKENTRVIENFSDIAQMDTENFHMNAIEFNIHEILQSIAHKLKTEMLTTQNGVVFKVDTALPKFFTGDMVRLENMLLTLLKFLLKGMHEGIISLSIKNGKKETSGNRLLFTLACNAQRFDEEQYALLDAIIHENAHLFSHGIDTVALKLCKAYVQKMGGELTSSQEHETPVLSWEIFMELSQKLERRKFRPLYKDIMHARTVIIDPNMIGVGVLRSELEYSKIPLGLFFTWESALRSFEQNGEVDLLFINADYLLTLPFDEVDAAIRRYCCKVILVCYKQPNLPSELQIWVHQIGAYVLEHPYTHEQLIVLLDRIYSENTDFQANVGSVSLKQD